MRSRTLLAWVTVAGVVALAGGWAVLGHDPGASARYVSEHSIPVPDTARTVSVSATMPAPSAHARRLSALLEAGAMPYRPVMAEVLTDTDCAPDAQMLSRCRNELELADGKRMVLRHPHDMRSVPCLAPGERVLVVPTV